MVDDDVRFPPFFLNLQLIGYFAFLIAHGCYKEVTLHYMIAGHTHFSPDRVFGWLRGQLKNSDIFDMEDVLKKLNQTHLAPRYSGMELNANAFEKWGELISPSFSRCRGIKKWHWIRLMLVENDEPHVLVEAKKCSSSSTSVFTRRHPVSDFPDMTVNAYQPSELSSSIIQALQFASAHIGDRTFRYLQEGRHENSPLPPL